MMTLLCKFEFEGFHCWPDAPSEHSYLGNLHRHMFRVTCWFNVEGQGVDSRREIEFIAKKREVQTWCEETMHDATVNHDIYAWSCEQWARRICDEFDFNSVEVLEDGENGAIYSP